MILVDASVILDHLRNRDPNLLGYFGRYPVAVAGVTRSEVLHGARNAVDRQKLLTFLARFAYVPTIEPVWDAHGDNLATLRSHGVTVQFPDALLATIGIHHDLEVWARDHHFPLMQKWLPALKLFQEPA